MDLKQKTGPVGNKYNMKKKGEQNAYVAKKLPAHLRKAKTS